MRGIRGLTKYKGPGTRAARVTSDLKITQSPIRGENRYDGNLSSRTKIFKIAATLMNPFVFYFIEGRSDS